MDGAEDDGQLIARLASGETTALDALYDRYASVTFALIVRIVADRTVAEDLLQEVFVRAWQRAATYQNARGRVGAWLLGIAHNVAIDELRRQRRRPLAVTERERDTLDGVVARTADAGMEVADEAWANLRRMQIEAALADLPPPQRRVIELAYFEGYTQSQIARRLDEPLGTVKTRLRLGLHKLRDLLQGQELELEAD